MPDREKVIKGLECCKIPFTKCYDGGCPYFENDGCKARLKGDALALLKAQEPINPIMVKGARSTYLKCGYCYAWLPQNEKPNYCSNCGKAVKWDG